MADPWTQDTVEAVLAGYEALKAHTQFIAAVVYNVRYPRDATQQFELEFDLEFGRVYVNYYYRQNHHQLTFPLAYVWADMEDIRPLETDRVAAERQADERQRQLREAAEDAEREAVERKMYERLKTKYEGTADGRQSKRTGPQRSPDTT